MSRKELKNSGASVRQRLLNLARQSQRPFQELLQYYMIERFIARLSKSQYRKRFVLKGALLFVIWELAESRPTRDIDLLGKTKNSVENIASIVKEICSIEDNDDGVEFLLESVECKMIQENNEYKGIRALFYGELAKARARMQIDIGFGDATFPMPTNIEYPTLLDMPTSQILAYAPESLIAEKVHAMVRHGAPGSRIKDYFDVWFLSRQFKFDGQLLAASISQTFQTRGLAIDKLKSEIFNPEYLDNQMKQKQWQTFIEKQRLDIPPIGFKEAMQEILLFISPIFEASKAGVEFQKTWDSAGAWSEKIDLLIES